MPTEHGSNGSEPPRQLPGPVQGLRLRPLPACADPAFSVLHDYFERVYGPLIGPAPTMLARAFARHVADAGGPVTICPVELSLELGLRASHKEPVGRNSPLARAIERLARHRLVQHIDPGTLGVVVLVPPITDRTVPKLPKSAQRAHLFFATPSRYRLAGPSAPPGSDRGAALDSASRKDE